MNRASVCAGNGSADLFVLSTNILSSYVSYMYLLFFAVLLQGCTIGRDVYLTSLKTPPPPTPPAITETTSYSHLYFYKIDPNYKIREVRSSNIGAVMIKVEDRYFETIDTEVTKETVEKNLNEKFVKALKLVNNASITGSYKTKKLKPADDITVTYEEGKVFNILGMLNSQYVVDTEYFPYQFLIDQKGYLVKDKFFQIDKGADDKHYHLANVQLKTSPDSIKFDVVYYENNIPDPRVVTDKRNNISYDRSGLKIPILNYELIYGGKDLTGIHVVYREFTGEGIARQPFFQNLNYETKAKTIRFKNTLIEVLSADNEKIVFRVLEDDLFQQEKAIVDFLPKDIVNRITKRQLQ